MPVTFTRYTPPGDASTVASTPFHLTIFSGSVRNGNTASGGASIRISSVDGERSRGHVVPFLGFHLVLQGREATVPERLEIGLELGERIPVRAIQAARAVSPLGDEAGSTQDREVLREIAGRLTSKCDAMSPADRSASQTRRRIGDGEVPRSPSAQPPQAVCKQMLTVASTTREPERPDGCPR